MKRYFILIIMALTGLTVSAQQAEDNQQPEHLIFQNLSMNGPVKDFADRMKARYKLKNHNRDEHCYIFQGALYGYSMPIQVYYTRKSQTVYKIMVTPKNVDENAWTDSLNANYGTPIDSERGLMWSTPGGIVLYARPEGYNPTVLWLDAQGQAVYKSEK